MITGDNPSPSRHRREGRVDELLAEASQGQMDSSSASRAKAS